MKLAELIVILVLFDYGRLDKASEEEVIALQQIMQDFLGVIEVSLRQRAQKEEE